MDSDRTSALEVVTPSQALTRKISRLIGAVAILDCRGTSYSSTARDDVSGKVSESMVTCMR